jgi:nitrous oxidase accessory protein NosD
MRVPVPVARPLPVLAAVVLGVGAAVAGITPAAAAAEVDLHPGDSIQTAIDNAAPGTTITLDPGTYRQFVVVWKDGITLRGEGGVKRVHIVPPLSGSSPCGGSFGVCVAKQSGVVHNVHITGITVENFGESGVFLFHSAGTRVDNMRLLNNGGYGAFALQSTGTRITESVAVGNHEAGFYVGESPDADATVSDNDAHGNGFGVFFRDARGAHISDNSLKDNCVGVVVLNTGFLPGAGNATLSDNTINHNDAACPPTEGPPTSGIGVVILGSDHVTVRDNTIDNNNAGGNLTLASGGVILLPGVDQNATPSNHVTVTDNHIRHNATDIIVGVPLATNVFDDNECGTSSPGGLC